MVCSSSIWCDHGAIAAAIWPSRVSSADSTSSRRLSICPTSSAWWSSNWPISASVRSGIFARIRPRARSAITRGSRSPATSAASIALLETVATLEATAVTLMLASSSSFSNRVASRVRSPIS